MFYFFLEVIGVSILVSLFANWIKLVPRYPNRIKCCALTPLKKKQSRNL